MKLQFLTRPEVRRVLDELVWGDRFEKELVCKFSNEDTFVEVRDLLLQYELVYQLFGENKSPYLSLTDKGIAVISRLTEIERILQGEDIDSE